MMVEKFIRWLIKVFLPGMHLSKNPIHKKKGGTNE